MAQVSKTAVSRVVASSLTSCADASDAADADAGGDKKSSRSRDDFKKQKELEEQRKLGNAPAAVDEEGRDINPHIPQYISDAPWYLDPAGPTLKHQRPQEEKVKKYSGIDEWYKKGVDAGKIATRYRKGACENCGATTHKRRDCLERPRKVGAKFSGANFAPDEEVQPELKLTFDGKRDRWNGYDNFAHADVVEEYEKLEEVKREVKKERLKANLGDQEEDDGAPSSDEDEDKYVDKMDMPGTKVDAAERYTVRNLRIREDTAKYLRNLDLSSAHYDPKTRSMRKNPYEATGKKEDDVDYAGDNFVRISGDTVSHAKSQMFAWETGRKGLEVHALAEPTKLEAMRKEFVEKKDKLEESAKDQVLEKYGGQEHLAGPPRELIFSQTENYVEYTRSGQVIRGEESRVVRSRYEEDVCPGNHTSVWGSYWSEGRWAYKCCYAFVKNAYCTGAVGRANHEAVTMAAAKKREEEENEAEEEEEETKKKKKHRKKKKRKHKEGDEEKEFQTKVAKAMKKIDEEEGAVAANEQDERKRGYNSLKGDDLKAPSEADMEAYYRKRQRTDDPMAKYL